jgi:hypothetical protein
MVAIGSLPDEQDIETAHGTSCRDMPRITDVRAPSSDISEGQPAIGQRPPVGGPERRQKLPEFQQVQLLKFHFQSLNFTRELT